MKNEVFLQRLTEVSTKPTDYARAFASYVNAKTQVLRDIAYIFGCIYRDGTLYKDDGTIDEEVFPRDYWYHPMKVIPMTIVNEFSEEPTGQVDYIVVDGLEIAKAINGLAREDDGNRAVVDFSTADMDIILPRDWDTFCPNVLSEEACVGNVKISLPFSHNLILPDGSTILYPRGEHIVTIESGQELRFERVVRPKVSFSVASLFASIATDNNINIATITLFDLLGKSNEVTVADVESALTAKLGSAYGSIKDSCANLISYASDQKTKIEDRISAMVSYITDTFETNSTDDSVYDDEGLGLTCFKANDYTGTPASAMWTGGLASSAFSKACSIVGNVIKKAFQLAVKVLVGAWNFVTKLWKKWITPIYQSKDFEKSDSSGDEDFVDVPLFQVGGINEDGSILPGEVFNKEAFMATVLESISQQTENEYTFDPKVTVSFNDYEGVPWISILCKDFIFSVSVLEMPGPVDHPIRVERVCRCYRGPDEISEEEYDEAVFDEVGNVVSKSLYQDVSVHDDSLPLSDVPGKSYYHDILSTTVFTPYSYWDGPFLNDGSGTNLPAPKELPRHALLNRSPMKFPITMQVDPETEEPYFYEEQRGGLVDFRRVNHWDSNTSELTTLDMIELYNDGNINTATLLAYGFKYVDERRGGEERPELVVPVEYGYWPTNKLYVSSASNLIDYSALPEVYVMGTKPSNCTSFYFIKPVEKSKDLIFLYKMGESNVAELQMSFALYEKIQSEEEGTYYALAYEDSIGTRGLGDATQLLYERDLPIPLSIHHNFSKVKTVITIGMESFEAQTDGILLDASNAFKVSACCIDEKTQEIEKLAARTIGNFTLRLPYLVGNVQVPTEPVYVAINSDRPLSETEWYDEVAGSILDEDVPVLSWTGLDPLDKFSVYLTGIVLNSRFGHQASIRIKTVVRENSWTGKRIAVGPTPNMKTPTIADSSLWYDGGDVFICTFSPLSNTLTKNVHWLIVPQDIPRFKTHFAPPKLVDGVLRNTHGITLRSIDGKSVTISPSLDSLECYAIHPNKGRWLLQSEDSLPVFETYVEIVARCSHDATANAMIRFTGTLFNPLSSDRKGNYTMSHGDFQAHISNYSNWVFSDDAYYNDDSSNPDYRRSWWLGLDVGYAPIVRTRSMPIELLTDSTLNTLLGELSNPIDNGAACAMRYKFGSIQLLSRDDQIVATGYLNPIKHAGLLFKSGESRFYSAMVNGKRHYYYCSDLERATPWNSDGSLARPNEWLLGTDEDSDDIAGFLLAKLREAYDSDNKYECEDGDVEAYRDLCASYRVMDLFLRAVTRPSADVLDWFDRQVDLPNGLHCLAPSDSILNTCIPKTFSAWAATSTQVEYGLYWLLNPKAWEYGRCYLCFPDDSYDADEAIPSVNWDSFWDFNRYTPEGKEGIGYGGLAVEISNVDFVSLLFHNGLTLVSNVDTMETWATPVVYHLLKHIVAMKPGYMKVHYLLHGTFPNFFPYLIGDRLSHPKWHINTDADIQSYVERACAAIIIAVVVIVATVFLGVVTKKLIKAIKKKQILLKQKEQQLNVDNANKLRERDQLDQTLQEKRRLLANASSDEERNLLKAEVKELTASKAEITSSIKSNLEKVRKNNRAQDRWASIYEAIGTQKTVDEQLASSLEPNSSYESSSDDLGTESDSMTVLMQDIDDRTSINLNSTESRLSNQISKVNDEISADVNDANNSLSDQINVLHDMTSSNFISVFEELGEGLTSDELSLGVMGVLAGGFTGGVAAFLKALHQKLQEPSDDIVF